MDLVPWCFWPGGEAANPDALHPGKARESSAGESLLSPSDVPGLSWARSPQTFRNPNAPGGACLLIPVTLFRPLRVQGGHHPGWGLGRTAPAFLLLAIKIVLRTGLITVQGNHACSKCRSMLPLLVWTVRGFSPGWFLGREFLPLLVWLSMAQSC